MAAEAGGEDARELAERLTAPLESATRLTMLNVLSAAMDEITRELAPGSVDVRLRGLDPDFVVTPPPAYGGSTEAAAAPVEPLNVQAPAEADEGGTARVNLRLPAHLKGACRGGREPRGPVGQRMVGPGGVGRGRRRHTAAYAGEDPQHRTELHGLGALAAPARPTSPTPRPTSGDAPRTQEDGTAMPSFDTPEPISVTAHVGAGSIRFTASDRPDTVVEVRPLNARGQDRTCGPPSRPRSHT